MNTLWELRSTLVKIQHAKGSSLSWHKNNRYLYPKQIFMNRCVSLESGAPPDNKSRREPPRTARTLLKINESQSILSKVQNPPPLDSSATKLLLYAKSNIDLVTPPFVSTCKKVYKTADKTPGKYTRFASRYLLQPSFEFHPEHDLI
jgi:hypothetical protein